MMVAVGPLVFLIVIWWQQRHEIAGAWRQRRIVSATLYWSIAVLYAVSGAAVMFSTVWAYPLGIRPEGFFAQSVTVLGFVSFGLLRIIAGKLAKPQLVAHDIPARERNAFHGLWMTFWMSGFVLGFLPLVIAG